ncbi:hypothetical protein M2337_002476 [Sphingobium sp. B2D3A]|nr:hypothetical protein [Sphingobium sp. B2D3A]MCW2384701.1 hypothetical protein [Sphingobium sp. B2D3D]
MRSAPAEVWLHVAPNLFVIRPRDFVEQSLRAHDHACDAISTLGRLLGDESALQHIHLTVGSKTFDGSNLSPLDRCHRGDAGKGRLPVNVNGAGPTLPEPTTIFGTIKAEVASQDIK